MLVGVGHSIYKFQVPWILVSQFRSRHFRSSTSDPKLEDEIYPLRMVYLLLSSHPGFPDSCSRTLDQ